MALDPSNSSNLKQLGLKELKSPRKTRRLIIAVVPFWTNDRWPSDIKEILTTTTHKASLVSEMTYYVSSGTLNPTHSLMHKARARRGAAAHCTRVRDVAVFTCSGAASTSETNENHNHCQLSYLPPPAPTLATVPNDQSRQKPNKHCTN